ncbi:LamG-like jellyroll fold domain-containing protein, partial [Klebsiella pneumoniae]|uniref:LamG-like jellyroll fold domain-containing protein n=1 Tax=Klebsiella pneumoniae TaxID=573 RepID=UPI0040444C98
RGIVSKGNGAYYMRTNGTDLESVRSLVAVLASSTGTLSTGTRYFCVITKTGTTRKVYVNATDVTDTLPGDSTTADNSDRLMIGQDSGGSEYF